jgi:hypothetical protein
MTLLRHGHMLENVIQGTELGTLRRSETMWITRGLLGKVKGGWTDGEPPAALFTTCCLTQKYI